MWSDALKDKTYQARIAALSIIQCTTFVNYLRAHDQNEHAENVETAIGVVAAIFSDELGRETLAQAIKWASDEAGGAKLPESLSVRH